MRGQFITFEGGEGAGKTTQINRLAQSLTAQGKKVATTREPGGTPEAEKIRDLLVQRDTGQWSPLSETLLLFAARTLHVERVIKPNLNDGKIVISDRFTDSTVAYQGYGHGLDLDIISGLKKTVLNDLEPNLTFILDIDAESGLTRSERRLASEALAIKQKEDRFENLELDFHDKLRNGFLKIAKDNPNRCEVIDATQEIDAIAEQILEKTLTRI